MAIRAREAVRLSLLPNTVEARTNDRRVGATLPRVKESIFILVLPKRRTRSYGRSVAMTRTSNVRVVLLTFITPRDPISY